MKVRIIDNGGSVHEIRVENAETGEIIEGITRVEYYADANTRDKMAVIYVSNPEIVIESPAEFIAFESKDNKCKLKKSKYRA